MNGWSASELIWSAMCGARKPAKTRTADCADFEDHQEILDGAAVANAEAVDGAQDDERE